MIGDLPAELRELYPFESRYMDIGGQNFLHYVDSGGTANEVLLCLHGNPTWSFMYRRVMGLNYRVLALDHLGCGLSTRPRKQMSIEQHVANLEFFIKSLGLNKISLLLHDWGGAIGMAWAVKNPGRVARLHLMNTAAFLGKLPKRILLCKTPVIGPALVRYLFAPAATSMAVVHALPKQVKAGMLWPYRQGNLAQGVVDFVKDIPLNAKHPSFTYLKGLGESLTSLQVPTQILWGAQDFCFHMGFLQRWQEVYPHAQVKVFPQAGHYLLEDAPAEVLGALEEFQSECC